MSGAVKSGLIFAAVGVVGVLALSFVPGVGALCCGPLAAALIGTVAGYYGVRWSEASAGVGQGVLAGAIAGIGALIGAVVFFVIALSIARANPQFNQAIQDALRQQPNARGVTPADVNAMVSAIGPFVGLCFGTIELLIALALGALGGWLATRNRTAPIQQPPMAPPPMAPPS